MQLEATKYWWPLACSAPFLQGCQCPALSFYLKVLLIILVTLNIHLIKLWKSLKCIWSLEEWCGWPTILYLHSGESYLRRWHFITG